MKIEKQRNAESINELENEDVKLKLNIGNKMNHTSNIQFSSRNSS